MREHSRKELMRKLAAHAPDQATLDQVLDELKREGWQSDERFVQSFEHSNQSRLGSRRIAAAMRERGVDDELVRASLDRLKDSELDRAWRVWDKRFSEQGLPTDPKEHARQARFLAGRGFGAEVVCKILAGRHQPESDEPLF